MHADCEPRYEVERVEDDEFQCVLLTSEEERVVAIFSPGGTPVSLGEVTTDAERTVIRIDEDTTRWCVVGSTTLTAADTPLLREERRVSRSG